MPEIALESQKILFTLPNPLSGSPGLFALPAQAVVEIYHAEDITLSPNMPAFVLGLVSRRGLLMPVYDLAKYWAVPDLPYAEDEKPVLLTLELELDTGIEYFALQVHAVRDLLPITPDVRFTSVAELGAAWDGFISHAVRSDSLGATTAQLIDVSLMHRTLKAAILQYQQEMLR